MNRTVLTLMVAGTALAYAAGTLAEAVAEPWRAPLLWAGIALALGSFALFYARFVEPSWIRVTKKTVALGVPGLRIAVVGDFHVGPHKRRAFVERAVAKINALRPDIVLLVGDFLFDHAADVAETEPLKGLRSPLGTFAVLGNHDSGAHGKHAQEEEHDRSEDVVAFLSPLGVTFLRNRSVAVTHGGKTFHVAGTDDVWMRSHDVAAAFREVPADAPIVLLAHNPDIILDPSSHRAALIVSGHTHGGQVRLPLYGSLTGLPTELNNKFDRGLFPVAEGCTLAITHGIGETFLPLRFLAHPEILLLETEE